MAKIIDFIRNIPAGTGVNAVSVSIKKHSDNSTLTTLTSDSTGRYTYNADGSPGPIYASASTGDRVRVRSGRATGQIGTWFGSDVPVALRALGDGVIKGYTDPETTAGDMAVSPGTGLQVLVAEGALLVDGHVYRCSAQTALTISANTSGSTRIDRIVVEFTREGQTEEGKCVLKVSEGTPSAGAPAVLNSNATRQVSLATVTVANGASSVSSGNITDTRPYTVGSNEIRLNNGADLIVYSDAGTTQKALLDGATGNLTLSGTLTTTRIIGETTIWPVLLGGTGSVLAAGVALDLPVPYNGKITGWDIYGDPAGAVVVDLWQDTYANYPPVVADTITGANKPTLTADTTKNTWTASSGAEWNITQGRIIRFNIDSASKVTRVLIALKVTKA